MRVAGIGVFHLSVKGAQWLLLGSLVQRLLSLITFFALARILTPFDYGVISVVFIILGFLETVTTPAFEKALIQRSGNADPYLDISWTLNLLRSLGIFLLIFFLASPLALFFHIDNFFEIIRWSGIFIIISSLGNSRQFYFFKNLEFKKVFIRDFVSQIIYTISALSWAFFIHRSAWALFVGHLMRYSSGAIASYWLYPYKPVFSFQFKKLKDLLDYSKWIVGQNFLGYILGAIDNIYVGRFLDAARLGFYSKAKDLALTPIAPFLNIINKVGFPAYAKLQDKLIKIEEGFLKTFDVIMSVTVPIFLLLLAKGGFIIKFLLGPQWLSLVVPLKIISAATIFGSFIMISKPMFDALGHPAINFKSNFIQLSFTLIFVYLGIRFWGLPGAAWAILISTIIVWFYIFYNIRSILRVNCRKLLASFNSILLAIGAVLIFAVPTYLLRMKDEEGIVFVISWFFILGIIYISALWFSGRLFKSGPKHTFLSIYKEIRGEIKGEIKGEINKGEILPK